jgi:hypothetical protein
MSDRVRKLVRRVHARIDLVSNSERPVGRLWSESEVDARGGLLG